MKKFDYDLDQSHAYLRACAFQAGHRIARRTNLTRHGTVQCVFVNSFTGKPSHAGVTWDDGSLEQVALKWLRHV